MGIVTEVGSKASSHFKVGDRAGIGCFVRACQVRDCPLSEAICLGDLAIFDAGMLSDSTGPWLKEGCDKDLIHPLAVALSHHKRRLQVEQAWL